MKIEILGSGCSKCKNTKEVVEKALKNSGVEDEVIKVEDFDTILNYGVMITPAVVINGEVNSVGKIPDEKEVKKWITE